MTRRAGLGAGIAVLALVAAGCALAWQPDSPLVPRAGGTVPGAEPLFLWLLLAAFVLYVVALLLIRRRPPPSRAVVAVAVAIQLVPLAAPLLLSTDAWTYWAYGWVGGEGGGNPYASPPEDFPRNPALPFMGADWRDTTTVYGPLFTLASEPIALVAGDSDARAAWTYKALAAAASIAAALLAGRIARRRAFAVALVGWNPVLAVHLAGGGHNDAWVAALLMAALALSQWRRAPWSGAMWAFAIFVKWIPLLFLALRAFERGPGGERRQVYRWLALTAGAAAVVATAVYSLYWPLAIFPLADNVALQTEYAIPKRLEQLGLPHAAAVALALAGLAAGLAWLAREARRDRARLGLAACLVLVTTPYLAVWYLAWAFPLAAADEDRTATFVCLALCAYLLPQTVPA